MNGENYLVSDGTVVFFDSYDVHSYNKRRDENDESYLLVIPETFLKDYKKLKGDRRVSVPVIEDRKLCDILVGICNDYLNTENRTIKHAALNLAIAFITERLGFVKDNEKRDGTLIRKILI